MNEEESTSLDFAKIDQSTTLSISLNKPSASGQSTQASSSSHLSTGTSTSKFISKPDQAVSKNDDDKQAEDEKFFQLKMDVSQEQESAEQPLKMQMPSADASAAMAEEEKKQVE